MNLYGKWPRSGRAAFLRGRGKENNRIAHEYIWHLVDYDLCAVDDRTMHGEESEYPFLENPTICWDSPSHVYRSRFRWKVNPVHQPNGRASYCFNSSAVSSSGGTRR